MPAPHVRRQIRDAFAAALAGLPTTGANVFAGRAYALDESERPGLIVGVGEEPGEISDIDAIGDAVILSRSVPITVDVYAGGETALDDLDAIAVEIEQAIAGGARLAHLADAVTLTGTRQRVVAEDRSRVGEMRMTWRVTYRTADTDPTIAV